LSPDDGARREAEISGNSIVAVECVREKPLGGGETIQRGKVRKETRGPRVVAREGTEGGKKANEKEDKKISPTKKKERPGASRSGGVGGGLSGSKEAFRPPTKGSGNGERGRSYPTDKHSVTAGGPAGCGRKPRQRKTAGGGGGLSAVSQIAPGSKRVRKKTKPRNTGVQKRIQREKGAHTLDQKR